MQSQSQFDQRVDREVSAFGKSFRTVIKAAIMAALTMGASQSMAFDKTHASWTALLKQYQTTDGRVKYAQLKKDAAAATHPFNVYLKDAQAIKMSEYKTWSKGDQMAFLINSYNALTIKLIVDNYPVASIKKIGGVFSKPWGIEFFSLLDDSLKSLDPIEHKTLRPQFKDFRVHAAVNCASASCPPLRHEAFVGERIDAQLDEQMRAWLADSSRNEFDAKTGELKISKIFDWYKDDFENWGGGVKTVLKKYAPTGAQAAFAKDGEISYLEYDWSLNESK